MKRAGIIAVGVIIAVVGVCQCLAADLFNIIEKPICTKAGDQINLDAGDPFIVWQDNRNGDWDIYIYDIDAGVESLVCSADGNQVNPCVFGGTILDVPRVVWQDDRGGNWDIYCAELDWEKLSYGDYTFQEKAICVDPADQICPDVSPGYVVWQDMRSGGWDIYGYNFEDGNEIVICDEAGDQIKPSMDYRSVVVWEDWRSGGADIYGYDIDDGNSYAICTVAGDQVSPCVSGEDIVWQDNRNGNWDIYGWKVEDVISNGEEVALCVDANSQQEPGVFSFSFPIVIPVSAAWQDNRNGNWDIWGYDQYNGKDVVICDAAGDQQGVVMNDPTFACWQDNRSGGWDIYMGKICSKGNDDCGYCAIELEVDEAYVGTTQGMSATVYRTGAEVTDTEKLTSSCGYNDDIDAWFIFEPMTGGPVTITTDGEFDTTLAVYNDSFAYYWSESIDLPVELACSDDYCSANTNSRVVMDVVKGKTYYIRVAGFNHQTGNYSIVVTQGGQGEDIKSDLNGDGAVNWEDFAIFSSDWLFGAE